jgi:hypothetical protein
MPDFSLSCGCYVPEDSEPDKCAQHDIIGAYLDLVRQMAETMNRDHSSLLAKMNAEIVYVVNTSSERVDPWPPSWLGWEDGYGHGV